MPSTKAQQTHAESDSEDDFYDNDSFHIREALPTPQWKDYTTAELHDLIHNADIDLDPPYQRDVVWPETKQIGLIDSILRNFYIPPVVFAVQKDEDGAEVRVCVDGKQRLTSIHKFMDGLIPFKDVDSRKSFWYTIPSPHKGTRQELPQHWKDQFATKKIACVEYHEVPSLLEREIFQRVQLGVTLTAAEKLHAITTPTSQWLLELTQNHIVNDGGLQEVFNWDTKRGRHFQNLAHIVYCCEGIPKEKRFPTAQKIEHWLSRTEEPSNEMKFNIELVLRDFWRIAKDEKLNFGFTKIDAARVAPAEFIFIGILLYMTKNRTYADRATAIHNLRLDVRSKVQDVRNNSTVGKVMWDFLSQYSTSSTVAKSSTTPKGIKKPRIGAPSPSAGGHSQVGKRTPPPDTVKAKAEAGKKRKAIIDDSDDEYSEALAVKHKAKSVPKKLKTAGGEGGGKKVVAGKKRKAPVDDDDDYSDLEKYAPPKTKKSQPASAKKPKCQLLSKSTSAGSNKVAPRPTPKSKPQQEKAAISSKGKTDQVRRDLVAALFDDELTPQEDSDDEPLFMVGAGTRQKRSSSKEV